MDTTASGGGIQFVYETCFASSNTFASSAINFDIQNSVTICNRLIAVLQKEADITNNAGVMNRMAFYADLLSMSTRIGAEYFPNQSMILTPSQQAEAIANTLLALNSLPHQYGTYSPNYNGTSLTIGDYQPRIDVANPGNGNQACKAVYAQNLDKSVTSVAARFSGATINNARLLNFNATKNDANGNNLLRTFSVSVRIANLSQDTCIVDR
jgi:hypothetical protein